MRLSLKLAFATALMAAVILIAFGLASLRHETVLIEADLSRDARLVSESLASLIEHTRNGSDASAVLDDLLVDVERDEREMAMRWRDVRDPSYAALPESVRAELARGHSVVYRPHSPDLPDSIHALAPVTQDGTNTGAVEVIVALASRDAYIRRSMKTDGLAILLITLASGAIALAAGRALVGARVEQLVFKARQVGAGDYGTPVVMGGGDELTVLAVELNQMAGQLETAWRQAAEAAEARVQAEAQLRHADRLTTVGQLSAGVAHELGTPLNIISGRAGLLEKRLSDEAAVSDARTIRDQARRITDIVKRMLDFSRRSRPSKRQTDIGGVVEGVLALLGTTARKADVDIHVRIEPGASLSCEVDPDQIQQVVTNLVMNGVQAMEDGGDLTVRVERARCGPEEADHIHIVVTDQGPGIPPRDLDRVFDPFFTTKAPGEGTGLGLSVVHGILADHGGAVTVESPPGEGATFTVHLPVEAA